MRPDNNFPAEGDQLGPPKISPKPILKGRSSGTGLGFDDDGRGAQHRSSGGALQWLVAVVVVRDGVVSFE